jgi:hypothetical protein
MSCLLEFRSLSSAVETVPGECVDVTVDFCAVAPKYLLVGCTCPKNTQDTNPDMTVDQMIKDPHPHTNRKKGIVKEHYSIPPETCLIYNFNYGSKVGRLFHEGILNQSALHK